MMRPVAGRLAGVAILALSACAAGVPEPGELDTRAETCSSCRMAVSDARFAAQIVAPGELPRFFDDVGCLGSYLRDPAHATRRGLAFVADHRTKVWVRADQALYTKVPGLETPMGYHLIAHADAASRDADPLARGGSPVSLAEMFGPAGPPKGGS